jgi:hypothetical protein
VWPDADRATIQRLVTARDRAEADIERGSAAPYRQVLKDSLLGVAQQENLAVPTGMEHALSDSLPTWPPFEDVPDALRELRARGWRLSILSKHRS